MKKKLLSILLIGFLIIVLAGCENKDNTNQEEKNNSSNNVQEQDENITKIKDFLTTINNKDYNKTINILEVEKINELLKISLPKEDYVKALNHSINNESSEMKYDLESIKKISKEDLLNEISKMAEEEIIKSRKDILNSFDNYDFYIVNAEITYNTEKTNYHDVVFINKNDSKIYGTVIINGLISYYYNAVYNKPNN